MPGKSRQSANLVSSNRITVNPTSGNVGIGSTIPVSFFEVSGNARVTGILTVGINSSIIFDGPSGIITASRFFSNGIDLSTVSNLGITSSGVFVGTATTIDFRSSNIAITTSRSGIVTVGVSSNLLVSAQQPSSPRENDIWFNILDETTTTYLSAIDGSGTWQANGGATLVGTTATLLTSTGQARSIVHSRVITSNQYDGMEITFRSTISGGADAIAFAMWDHSSTTLASIGGAAAASGVNVTSNMFGVYLNFFSSYIRIQGVNGSVDTSYSGSNITGTHIWKIVLGGSNYLSMNVSVYRDGALVTSRSGVQMPVSSRFAFGGGSGGFGASAVVDQASIIYAGGVPNTYQSYTYNATNSSWRSYNPSYSNSSGSASYSSFSGISTVAVGFGTTSSINTTGIITSRLLNVGIGGTIITTTGIGSIGIGTNIPRFNLEVGAVGASGTSLWVNNNARITGNLAVGSLSGVAFTSLSDVNIGINTLVDGRALIYQGGQWVGGPIIGGFNYSTGDPFINNVITLLHMDGSNGSTNFYDHSPSAVVYNRYGSVTISTTQSKFGGASGYFNGTGSIYISNPNTVFGQITGDFTLECWVYWVSTPPGNANGLERTIIGQTNWPESASGNWWWLYGLSTGFGWGVYNGGSGEGVGYNFTWQANRWYHLAVSRSNGTVYLFLDGALVGSAPSTKPMFVDNVREFSIGGDNGGNSTLCNAYIEEVRFTKGVGRYTTNFTPQTIAFPNPFDANFSNVSLLLHMDGANASTTFTDSSSNAISASVFGNAQISTTQSKFRGASALFDGNGDYLQFADSELFNFGSGDFTIEMWIYPNSIPGAASGLYPSLFSQRNGYTSEFSFSFHLAPGGAPNFEISNTGNASSGSYALLAGTAVSATTWTHVAVTRQSGTLRMFQNGVLTGTNSNANFAIYNSSATIKSGAFDNPAWSNSFYNGYIDDLRVTKGVARYTSNFSVPTAPFPDQVGVSSSLLYSINNLDDVDTSTVSPIDGQSLAWNSLTNQWVPRTVGLGTTSSINTTGIITASSFSGNGSGLTNVRASYASTAGIATYANASGISTYSSVSGISTNVIGGIGSVTQLAVSGISSLGIVTALRYYGDGKFLDNIYRFSASSSPPSNPSLGDDWFNLDTGVLYKYINDNDNNFWYDTSDRPFNLTIFQEGAPVGFGVTLIDFFGAEIVTSPLSGIATITVSSQVTLPTGDYGNLDPLPELDAFGIEISQSYDALVDPPESLVINDLGQL